MISIIIYNFFFVCHYVDFEKVSENTMLIPKCFHAVPVHKFPRQWHISLIEWSMTKNYMAHVVFWKQIFWTCLTKMVYWFEKDHTCDDITNSETDRHLQRSKYWYEDCAFKSQVITIRQRFHKGTRLYHLNIAFGIVIDTDS